MTMPTWINELQAFCVPAIAIGTVCVAVQQFRIAKQKLRLDLYDRGLAIYQAFHDGVVTALNHRFKGPVDELTGNLGIRVREARFLFDATTFEYLNKLETDILVYRHIHLTIEGHEFQTWNNNDVASYNEDHAAISRRLLASLQGLPSLLHQYMSIDDRLSFSVKPSSEVSRLLGSVASNVTKAVS